MLLVGVDDTQLVVHLNIVDLCGRNKNISLVVLDMQDRFPKVKDIGIIQSILPIKR